MSIAATTTPPPIETEQANPLLWILFGVALTILLVRGLLRIVVSVVTTVAAVIESIATVVFAVGVTAVGLGVIGASTFVVYLLNVTPGAGT